MNNSSTLSKINKSASWKQRKRQMHEANKALRASLESQKANSSGADKKAQIQKQIDAIGAGAKVK